MKQIKNIFIISLFFAAFIFAGCNRDVSIPQKNDDVQGYTLKGGININMDAFPSELSGKTSARMALPDIDSSSLEINCDASTVTGINHSSGYKIKGRLTKNNFSDEYEYNILLPFEGEWEIQLVVKTDTMTLIGSDTVNIEKYLGIIQNVSDDPDINLVPLITQGEYGSINLRIRNDARSNEGGSYEIVWTWYEKPETQEDESSIFGMDMDDEFSDYISFDNVSSGSYKVNIAFKKDSQTVYSCDQWIHVFGDMETDTWNGSGFQYTTNSGNTYLSLTYSAMDFYLSAHQLESPKPNNVYYKWVAENEYELGYVSNKNYAQKAASLYAPVIEPPDGVTFANDGKVFVTNVYAYDKYGIIYYAGYVMSNDNKPYYYILAYTPDDESEYFLFEAPDLSGSETEIKAICFDAGSDCMYIEAAGKTGAENFNFPRWYQIELNAVDHQVEIMNTFAGVMTKKPVDSFVVQDDLLYFCEYEKGIISVICYELIDGNEINFLWKNMCLDFSSLMGNYKNHVIEFTDMVCINGYIYILFKDYYNSTSELYCRGGVMRYSIRGQSASEYVGFARTDVFNFSSIRYYCSAEDGNRVDLYPDREHADDPFRIYVDFMQSGYFPNDPSSEFYGPQKILSYDNQYLYIADSGYDYYLDSVNDNEISFTPKNRVVKFAITSTMGIESVTELSVGDTFTYQPEDYLFILGPEGYEDSTVVIDVDENEYTVRYPYIPKKQ